MNGNNLYNPDVTIKAGATVKTLDLTKVTNLTDIVIEDGATVGIDELVASGIIKKVEAYGLKVLGNGTLEKKLTVKANKFTASAVEKIAKFYGIDNKHIIINI